jgi:PAT family beta-lactamase induction signal transducer AmpG
MYAPPGKLLMGTSGFVVDAIGYPWFFVYTSSLGIPALVMLYFLTRQAGRQNTTVGTAGR